MARGRVLMVDHEADARKSTWLTRTTAGCDVLDAEDWQKAVEAIRSCDKPPMVEFGVCDLHRPNVNCTEVNAVFRAQFPCVPIVIVTGDVNLDRATTLFKRGIANTMV